MRMEEIAIADIIWDRNAVRDPDTETCAARIQSVLREIDEGAFRPIEVWEGSYWLRDGTHYPYWLRDGTHHLWAVESLGWTHVPAVILSIISIPLLEIKGGGLIAGPYPRKLIKYISRNGLECPIDVDYRGGEFYLRHGTKRYFTALILGWEKIDAIVQEGAEALVNDRYNSSS